MKRYLPALVWMIFIFYLSSRSTAGVLSTDPLERVVIYKSLHLIEYAVLGVLIYFANKKTNSTVLIAYLYACSDEIHQFFVVGRTCNFTDTLVDLVGIIIGIFLIKKFFHPYHS